MIESFKDKETARVWQQRFSKRLLRDIQLFGYQKFVVLHRSKNLNDLRVPPSNRLERLSGDRKGQHSIRINDQWRICFRWNNGKPTDAEITDYH